MKFFSDFLGGLVVLSFCFLGCLALNSCASAPVSEPVGSAPRERKPSVPTSALGAGEVEEADSALALPPLPENAPKASASSSSKKSVEPDASASLSPSSFESRRFVTDEAENKSGPYAFARDIKYPESNDADEGEDDLVFNFDNADLYEVIRTMASLLEINYIVDPGISGRVTIHTAGKLKKSNLFQIFNQILEANGLAAIKEGNVYKIGPLKNAPRSRISTRFGRDFGGAEEGERVIMQIVPLQFISAAEMTKLLTPFISADGTIISHGDTNTLLIVDRDIAILKALELVKVFDIDLFEDVRHRFYTLDYLGVDEMSKILSEIMQSYRPSDRGDFKIIPIQRLNMLLMIGKEQGLFDKAEAFIRRLDVPTADVTPRIFVYYVKNGDAEDLASLLGAVFGSGVESREAGGSRSSPTRSESEGEETAERKNPFAVTNPFSNSGSRGSSSDSAGRAIPKIRGHSNGQPGAGTLRGNLTITPDPARNALIIECIPSDYQTIETILKKLDVLPRQVLIEVVIAEISLDGSESLGVEWEYRRGEGGSPSLALLSGQMGAAGLQYTIGQTNRWSANFSALASQNKVNILSAPVVLASDNKEAKISVSDQIPVASAEYVFNSGGEGVTQTNIQYRDTGIILTVTPRINERGLVTMDISQEVSEQGDGVNVGGQSFPSFRERSVNTSLTVKHGQTLVMGGLMREREGGGKSGVPYLSRIPGLGFLFGRNQEEFVKTELILLITPNVIVSLEDIEAVTEEFKQKVEGIRLQHRSAESSLFYQEQESAPAPDSP
jgi:general secretion pathway protein D